MKFTAVAHPQSYQLQKRDALLFDSIGLILLDRNLGDLTPEAARETEWLMSRGVIEDVAITLDCDLPEGDAHKYHVESAAYYLVSESLRRMADGSYSTAQGLAEGTYFEAADAFAPVWNLDPQEVAVVASVHAAAVFGKRRPLEPGQLLDVADVVLQAGYDASARFTALCLTKRQMSDAIPILVVNPLEELPPPPVTPLRPVAAVVLDGLPTPDPSTPWEAILEFRSDEPAIQSLRRLRRWLRTFASQGRSPAEIREEIEYMIQDHMAYLSLHKITSTRSRLDILLSLEAEAIDTLEQLKFEAATQTVVEVRKHQMGLYELERAAAGREVAYITNARRRLSDMAVGGR
jgi:hypothetical protein